VTSGGNNLHDFPPESSDRIQISCSLHSEGQPWTKMLTLVVYAGLELSDDDHRTKN